MKKNCNYLTNFGLHNTEDEEFTTNTSIEAEPSSLSVVESDAEVKVEKIRRNKFKINSTLPVTSLTKGNLTVGEDEYDYDLTITKTPDQQSFQVNVKFPKPGNGGGGEYHKVEIISSKEVLDYDEEPNVELHEITKSDTTDTNGDVDKPTIILHITQYYENPTDPDVIQEISDTADEIYDYFTSVEHNNFLLFMKFNILEPFIPTFEIGTVDTSVNESDIKASITQDEVDSKKFIIDQTFAEPQLSVDTIDFDHTATNWDIELTKEEGKFLYNLSATLPKPVIEIGSVTTGEPDVELVQDGENTKYTMNITLPDPIENTFTMDPPTFTHLQSNWKAEINQDTNDDKNYIIALTLPAPHIQIGTVTTLPYGSSATAQLVQNTPNSSWNLNLGIPSGKDGEDAVQQDPDNPNQTIVEVDKGKFCQEIKLEKCNNQDNNNFNNTTLTPGDGNIDLKSGSPPSNITITTGPGPFANPPIVPPAGGPPTGIPPPTPGFAPILPTPPLGNKITDDIIEEDPTDISDPDYPFPTIGMNPGSGTIIIPNPGFNPLLPSTNPKYIDDGNGDPIENPSYDPLQPQENPPFIEVTDPDKSAFIVPDEEGNLHIVDHESQHTKNLVVNDVTLNSLNGVPKQYYPLFDRPYSEYTGSTDYNNSLVRATELKDESNNKIGYALKIESGRIPLYSFPINLANSNRIPYVNSSDGGLLTKSTFTFTQTTDRLAVPNIDIDRIYDTTNSYGTDGDYLKMTTSGVVWSSIPNPDLSNYVQYTGTQDNTLIPFYDSNQKLITDSSFKYSSQLLEVPNIKPNTITDSTDNTGTNNQVLTQTDDGLKWMSISENTIDLTKYLRYSTLPSTGARIPYVTSGAEVKTQSGFSYDESNSRLNVNTIHLQNIRTPALVTGNAGQILCKNSSNVLTWSNVDDLNIVKFSDASWTSMALPYYDSTYGTIKAMSGVSYNSSSEVVTIGKLSITDLRDKDNSSGTNGQVLTKVSGGLQWASAPGVDLSEYIKGPTSLVRPTTSNNSILAGLYNDGGEIKLRETGFTITTTADNDYIVWNNDGARKNSNDTTKKKWNIWVEQGSIYDRFRIMMGSATMMNIDANGEPLVRFPTGIGTKFLSNINTTTDIITSGWKVELVGNSTPQEGEVLRINSSGNATWAQPTLPSNASVRVNKVNTVYFGNKSPYEDFGWEVELWGTTQPMPGRVLAIDGSGRASWLTLDDVIEISLPSLLVGTERLAKKLTEVEVEEKSSKLVDTKTDQISTYVNQSKSFRTVALTDNNQLTAQAKIKATRSENVIRLDIFLTTKTIQNESCRGTFNLMTKSENRDFIRPTNMMNMEKNYRLGHVSIQRGNYKVHLSMTKDLELELMYEYESGIEGKVHRDHVVMEYPANLSDDSCWDSELFNYNN